MDIFILMGYNTEKGGGVCMFKTLLNDRYTIERKYHDPDKPFNPYIRMAYHGYDYDESTGLDDSGIHEGLEKLSAELSEASHPVCKARLLKYVLDNTRIDINEHDYFIGIYTWNRPISQYTVHRWNSEVYGAFPEESKILEDFDRSGACFGWLDFDHNIPDWTALTEKGFSGILARVEECYHEIQNPTEKSRKIQKSAGQSLRLEYSVE